MPAGDIALNPYFKRDMRRSYPRLSVVNQADVVGLLSVGSKATPKEDVLQIGEAGAKQLVQVKQEGEERGLAALFEKDKKSVAGLLGPSGMPPLPMALGPKQEAKQYVMDRDREQGFPEECVARLPALLLVLIQLTGTHAGRSYRCTWRREMFMNGIGRVYILCVVSACECDSFSVFLVRASFSYCERSRDSGNDLIFTLHHSLSTLFLTSMNTNLKSFPRSSDQHSR